MSLLNNGGLLKGSAFKQTFQVKRAQAGQRDGITGKWVPAAPTDPVSATGSIQPVNEAGMQRLRLGLEGGMRITEAIRVYTAFDLKAGSLGGNGTLGDVVVYRGLDWSVIQISDYSAHGHNKVYGVRCDAQNG